MINSARMWRGYCVHLLYFCVNTHFTVLCHIVFLFCNKLNDWKCTLHHIIVFGLRWCPPLAPPSLPPPFFFPAKPVKLLLPSRMEGCFVACTALPRCLSLSVCCTSALIFSFFRAPKGEQCAPTGTGALSQAWSSGIPSLLQSSHRRCCPRLRPPARGKLEMGPSFVLAWCNWIWPMSLTTSGWGTFRGIKTSKSKMCPAHVHTLYWWTRLARG